MCKYIVSTEQYRQAAYDYPCPRCNQKPFSEFHERNIGAPGLDEMLANLTDEQRTAIRKVEVEIDEKSPQAASQYLLCGIVASCLNDMAQHTVETTEQGFKHTWKW